MIDDMYRLQSRSKLMKTCLYLGCEQFVYQLRNAWCENFEQGSSQVEVVTWLGSNQQAASSIK